MVGILTHQIFLSCFKYTTGWLSWFINSSFHSMQPLIHRLTQLKSYLFYISFLKVSFLEKCLHMLTFILGFGASFEWCFGLALTLNLLTRIWSMSQSALWELHTTWIQLKSILCARTKSTWCLNVKTWDDTTISCVDSSRQRRCLQLQDHWRCKTLAAADHFHSS